MNFVADAGILPRTVRFLHDRGHTVVHVRDLGIQRAKDIEILELARARDSVVLTFDLDFGDLLALGLTTSRVSSSSVCKTNRRIP
jgi:predicted nuclease of predicted toxin-antitoxin system